MLIGAWWPSDEWTDMSYPSIIRAENELGSATDNVTTVAAADINTVRRHVEHLSGAADADTFVWQSLEPLDYKAGDPFSETDIVPRFNVVLSGTVDQTSDEGDPGVDPQPTSPNKPVAIGWNWNVNAGAPEMANYPAFGLRFEPWFRWPTGDLQVCEFHYQYNPSPQSTMYGAGRTGALRPLSIIVNHDSGATTWDVDTSTFSWNYPSFSGNTTTQKVKFNLAGSPSSVELLDGTGLVLNASSNAFLSTTSYLRVGDSSNYIRPNANTGLIEFAGTSRPTMRIPLLPHVLPTSTAVSYLTGSGTKVRYWYAFNNADTDYYTITGLTVGADWDLTADWLVKIQLVPVDATAAGSTDIVRFNYSLMSTVDGTRFDNPTEIHTDTATLLDFDTTGLRVPKTFTLATITAAELSTGSVAAGTTLSMFIQRDANDADANDTYDDVIYMPNLWMEVRKKQV